MTSTDLTIQSNLAEEMDYARAIAPAALLPQAYRGKPADILIAMNLGEAIGITRAQALYEIYVVNGRPSPSANLMAALVRRAGHKLRVRGDAKVCTATLIRADDPEAPFEATWTIEQANAAKLTGKDTWRQYPSAMLRARAISEVVRMGAPEAVLGMEYSREEMGDLGAPAPAQAPSERSATATLRNVVAPEPTSDTPVVDAINRDRDEAAEAAPSQAQVGRMFALFGEVLTDVPDARTSEGRAARLAYIAAVIGREVESSKDLSITEVSAVIDALQADKQAAQTTDDEFAAAAGENDPWDG